MKNIDTESLFHNMINMLVDIKALNSTIERLHANGHLNLDLDTFDGKTLRDKLYNSKLSVDNIVNYLLKIL
jgi:hypothetical protein